MGKEYGLLGFPVHNLPGSGPSHPGDESSYFEPAVRNPGDCQLPLERVIQAVKDRPREFTSSDLVVELELDANVISSCLDFCLREFLIERSPETGCFRSISQL